MRLPRSVQEIAEVIGNDRALYLIGQLPTCTAIDQRTGHKNGRRAIMYVPTLRSLKPDHALVRILGWKDAEKLARHFGGEILQPASCTEIYRPFRDLHITRLVREGIPAKLIAEWFSVTDRHVRAVMSREIPQEDCRAANDNNATIRNSTTKQARVQWT